MPTNALSDPKSLALIVFSVGSGAVLTALGFEHIGGYHPCPLCLLQRYAYYAAIPVVAIALWAVVQGRMVIFAALMALVAVGYAINTGLGVYHSGVEWGWFEGPSDCSGGGMSANTGDLLSGLEEANVVRCDEAPWRMFGLSFAGWSAVISLVLAIFSIRAATLRNR